MMIVSSYVMYMKSAIHSLLTCKSILNMINSLQCQMLVFMICLVVFGLAVHISLETGWSPGQWLNITVTTMISIRVFVILGSSNWFGIVKIICLFNFCWRTFVWTITTIRPKSYMGEFAFTHINTIHTHTYIYIYIYTYYGRHRLTNGERQRCRVERESCVCVQTFSTNDWYPKCNVHLLETNRICII